MQDNVIYTKYTSAEERAALPAKIDAVRLADERNHSIRQLEPSELEQVQGYLATAQAALDRMGVDRDAYQMPDPAQLTFTEKSAGSREGNHNVLGGKARVGGHIQIDTYSGSPIDSPDTQSTVIHEVSHAVKPAVVANDPINSPGFRRKTSGFTRSERITKDIDGNVHRTTKVRNDLLDKVTHKVMGPWEEGVADLFVIYALNDGSEIPTPYTVRAALMASLIQHVAALKGGTTEAEVFEELFKAMVERDFHYQEELAYVLNFQSGVLGRDVIKAMNNMIVDSEERGFGSPKITEGASHEEALEIARSGGFEELYLDNHNKLWSGEGVTLDGIDGRLVASRSYCAERDPASMRRAPRRAA